MATAILAALGAQFVLGLDIPTFRPSNFFSYFTVLSNISALIVLDLIVLRPSRLIDPSFSRWRGASTLYMGVTGIIYVTLLLPLETDVGVTEPWIDWVIHGIGPLFMIADWLFNPPLERRPWSDLGYWMIFPGVYLVYTLIRGPIVDWYPYPFLDPREDGYIGVAIGVAIVIVAFLAIGAVLLARARGREPSPVAAP